VLTPIPVLHPPVFDCKALAPNAVISAPDAELEAQYPTEVFNPPSPEQQAPNLTVFSPFADAQVLPTQIHPTILF